MPNKKISDFRNIDHAIAAKAHTPMYVMHKFWARKPHNVVSEYIKRYSKKGDIILDPFCGSGPTPLEAVKNNRKAVGIDVNPVAIFITKMTGKPVNLKDIIKHFNDIEKLCKNTILQYYKTKCKTCEAESEIICTVWDRDTMTIEEIRYYCKKCDEKRHKSPDDKDYKLLDEIENTKIKHWYPKDKLNYDDGNEFKEGTHIDTLSSISSLFTKRNLNSLSTI